MPNTPNRRENVILTRLGIGHTKLTYGYLMTKGRHPECHNSELTVDHTLTKCIKYEELRKKYELPENVKMMLGPETPKDKIIGYLNESNFINKI